MDARFRLPSEPARFIPPREILVNVHIHIGPQASHGDQDVEAFSHVGKPYDFEFEFNMSTQRLHRAHLSQTQK